MSITNPNNSKLMEVSRWTFPIQTHLKSLFLEGELDKNLNLTSTSFSRLWNAQAEHKSKRLKLLGTWHFCFWFLPSVSGISPCPMLHKTILKSAPEDGVEIREHCTRCSGVVFHHINKSSILFHSWNPGDVWLNPAREHLGIIKGVWTSCV